MNFDSGLNRAYQGIKSLLCTCFGNWLDQFDLNILGGIPSCIIWYHKKILIWSGTDLTKD